MTRRAPLVAAAAALLAAGPLRADELPLETLALNDTASVQEALELQVSLFPAYLGWKNPRHDAYGAGLELELGVVDGVQLAGELPLEHHATDAGSATGLGNAELGASVAILDDAPIFLAAGVEAEFPASDPLIGEDSTAVGPFVLSDLALGPIHLALGAGLEVELADETELVPVVGGGVYAEFGKLVPVLEAHAELAEEADVRLAPGVFWNPSETWEFGAFGLFGLTEAAPDYGAIGVVTLELELAGEGEEEK